MITLLALLVTSAVCLIVAVVRGWRDPVHGVIWGAAAAAIATLAGGLR